MDLEYIIAGKNNGAPLIVIHGFLGDSIEMKEIFPFDSSIKDKYQIIYISLPLLSHDYVKDNFDQYILKLNSLILKKWHNPTLMGYSLGGRVALSLMLLNHQCYKEIICISSSMSKLSAEERLERSKYDQKLLDKIENTEDIKKFLTNWYKMPLFGEILKTKEILNKIDKYPLSQIKRWRKLINILSVSSQKNSIPLLEKTPPFKFNYICGSNDIKYLNEGHSLKAQFPWINLNIIKNSYHAPHLDEPEKVKKLLCKILAN